MQFDKAKLVAANLLNVGKNRVWISPEEKQRVSEAMTKQDLKALIGDGVIKKKGLNYQSRARARALAGKKKRGRKRGSGKRRGTKKTRMEKKRFWMKNVRAQRRTLKELKKKKKGLGEFGYSRLYRLVKGNYFRGKKYVEAFAADLEKKGKK